MQMLSFFIAVVIIFNLLRFSDCQLQVGFYSDTCSFAETIVGNVIQQAVAANPGAAAALLRLQFHDCFVEGCDASILIEREGSEKEAPGNAGVTGFRIIEDAKAELESVCPGIVSCADIIALAVRDAILLSKGPFYDVPTGRRDGRVSDVTLALNLPEVTDPLEVLKSKFNGKGLSDKDLVLLSSGAHTIGFAACFFITGRLYNFSSAGGSDPTINPNFLPKLKAKCPADGDIAIRVPLDWGSQFLFDDHIFRNIKKGSGVIASDAILYKDINMRRIVDSYLDGNSSLRANFSMDFAQAMVKMGSISVKTGAEGEIRRLCGEVN